MKLHEAIELILRNEGNNISVEDVTDIINRENLYIRKDHLPILASQVQLRIKNYPDLFVINGNNVSLKDGIAGQLNYLASRIEDFILMDNPNSNDNILIIAGWFYAIKNHGYFNQDFIEASNKLMFIQSFLRLSYAREYFTPEEQKHIVDRILMLKDSALTHIAMLTFDLYPSSHEISDEIFRDFLKNLVESRQGLNGSPVLNSNIVNALSLLYDNDIGQRIYNPFSSSLGMIIPIIKDNDTFPHEFILSGLNVGGLLLNKLILLSYGVRRVDINSSSNSSQTDRYDQIVSVLPAGQIPRHNLEPFKQISNLAPYGVTNRMEIMALQTIVRELSENGRAILLVPDNLLISTNSILINLRRDIISNDWLETLVSLPQGKMFKNMNFKCSLMLLNKRKRSDQRGVVSLFNLSEYDPESTPNNDEIFNNFTSIDINDFDRDTYKFTLINSRIKTFLNSGQNLVKLGDVVKVKSIGVNIRKTLLNNASGVPYINIRDLSPDEKMPIFIPEKVGNFITDIDEVPSNRIWQIKNELRKGTLLLAKNGSTLKPTLIDRDIEGVCSNNIIALQPLENKVTPNYLLSQFKSEYVLQQISDIRTGTVIPFLKTSELLEIEIILPPLDEQEKLGNAALFEYFSKIGNRDLTFLDDGRPGVNIVGIVKHEFGNLKRPLEEDVKSIKEYLKHKILQGTPVSIEDKISQRPDSRNVFNVFDQIHQKLHEMGSLLEDMQALIDIETTEIQASQIELSEIFNDLTNDFGKSLFRISGIEGKKVDVDAALIKMMFRNLISNAIKHGFDNEPTNECIQIEFIHDETGNVQIDLRDIGKGFEKEFDFSDFISYGKKTGENQGHGFGGYLIHQIIQKNRGSIELLNKEQSHFRILLPIKQ